MTEKREKNNFSKLLSKDFLLSTIKEIQKLPEEVVVDFLKSKGKLSQSDFARRIKV